MDSILKENNLLDFSVLLLYVFLIIYYSNKEFKPVSKRVFFLSLFIGFEHLFFTLVYYFFSFSNIADATLYFLVTKSYTSFSQTSIVSGTNFIEVILYPLIHGLNLSYLSCYLTFSFFSFVGTLKLYKILIDLNSYQWSKWYYILILPSIHFWVAAIGKDAVIFFAISSLLYCYHFKKNLISYIVPIILIGLIRFYILAFIAIAFFVAVIFISRKINALYKTLLLALCFGSLTVVVPFFLGTVNIESVESISERRQMITEANMAGGGAINLANSNILVKLFSYLFRPLFVDAANVLGLLASIENIFWLIIFYKIFTEIRHFKRQDNTAFLGFCISAIFSITLPAAFLLSNLGIAARQKVMIVPFLFAALFMIIANKNNSVIHR